MRQSDIQRSRLGGRLAKRHHHNVELVREIDGAERPPGIVVILLDQEEDLKPINRIVQSG